MHPLYVAAGPAAMRHIQSQGFSLQDVGLMLGASGGPKWLVLNRLDRYLATQMMDMPGLSIDLLGTSIGSWRFACYAQADPVAALDRFEEVYFYQAFSAKPDPREVSQVCGSVLDAILNGATQDILNNQRLRLHALADRCRPAVVNRQGDPTAMGLLKAAIANTFHRPWLGRFFERVLFQHPLSQLHFQDFSFPLSIATWQEDNLQPALMASGSIPLIMEAIRDIQGAPEGKYVDGGIIDYHFNSPIRSVRPLTLYLHFSPRIIPGWFDKALPWRQPHQPCFDNTLLIAPSQNFIASLPGGKIPDRKDFLEMSNDERVQIWRKVLNATEQLVDDLDHLLRGGLHSRLIPLPLMG